MSEIYGVLPDQILQQIVEADGVLPSASFCAGFELEIWRCKGLAENLMEWIADYALIEDELKVNHGNMFVRLREAAIRIYHSENYKKRGEVGEIALHGICRKYFGTFPIAPRVFYLTASNDVVKAFDLVHVAYPESGEPELWLGEAKFYEDAHSALREAIASIETHIDGDFLRREKLILGPQISKSLPEYDKIKALWSTNTSLNALFQNAVFPVFIMANSAATASSTDWSDEYFSEVRSELQDLTQRLERASIATKIRLLLIYVPLGSKAALADRFDALLKGISG